MLFSNPILLFGICLPFLAAVILLVRKSDSGRSLAVAASLVSVLLVATTPGRDPVMLLPAITHGVLVLISLLLLPRQDATSKSLAGILILAGATQICYSASTLQVEAMGWWLTLTPFLANMFGEHRDQRWSQAFLVLSALALTIGAWTGSVWLLIAAVVLRKGVFPFQGGALAKFEHGSLIPAALLFNSHLGAVLVTKMPDHHSLDWLGAAALASSVLLSIRAFAEKKPRRILAHISLSQASFILAGLTLKHSTGVTGALLHWFVVSITCVSLACIIRAVEVRVAGAQDPKSHLGLAVHTPRLAVFFLLSAVALIGLPGTLGYCAEDLLFHGALEEHLILGIALPVATAFNAINLIRLFGVLFLGVLPKHVPNVPDALPRERWPLAIAACALVVFGLVPRAIMHYAIPAAKAYGVSDSESH